MIFNWSVHNGSDGRGVIWSHFSVKHWLISFILFPSCLVRVLGIGLQHWCAGHAASGNSKYADCFQDFVIVSKGMLFQFIWCLNKLDYFSSLTGLLANCFGVHWLKLLLSFFTCFYKDLIYLLNFCKPKDSKSCLQSFYVVLKERNRWIRRKSRNLTPKMKVGRWIRKSIVFLLTAFSKLEWWFSISNFNFCLLWSCRGRL